MADADVIVVGAGLAGLVAACEAGRTRAPRADRRPGERRQHRRAGVLVVRRAVLRRQPRTARLGIRDSHELALQDWLGTAGFDRPEDHWPRQWAHAYVDFAAGEKRSWLRERGLQTFPLVGWAERGGYDARGHGNSVPRFHITWGTGPAIVDIFARRLLGNAKVRFAHRHRVDELIVEDGAVVGVRGAVLEPTTAARGVASSRNTVGEFEFRAPAVIVASGGIGGNHDLVRQNWPKRMGRVPEQLLSGVPAHVDGRMIGITESAGAHVINSDRMWHYTEGITNYDPIWPAHGIRILPGPSSLWLDATGKRLPAPLYPGFDTLGTLEYIAADRTGLHLVRAERPHHRQGVRAVRPGAEPRPHRAQRRDVLARVRPGAPAPVQAFVDKGVDFVSANSLRDLVSAMNAVPDVTAPGLRHRRGRGDRARPRGRQPVHQGHPGDGDPRGRGYLGDRFSRVVAPHRLTDPKAGPLIAVKLHILTRKSLGGLETDLDSRVLKADGSVFAGLYAAGEAAGFGGGGVHGYRSLEGTFLGGCVFSGRAAGRAAARDLTREPKIRCRFRVPAPGSRCRSSRTAARSRCRGRWAR